MSGAGGMWSGVEFSGCQKGSAVDSGLNEGALLLSNLWMCRDLKKSTEKNLGEVCFCSRTYNCNFVFAAPQQHLFFVCVGKSVPLERTGVCHRTFLFLVAKANKRDSVDCAILLSLIDWVS